MKKIKTVLVTGAHGFVGLKLSEFLLAKGYNVIGLAFGQGLHPLRKHKNFISISADIRDGACLNAVFKKYKPAAVFHTAALLPKPRRSITNSEFFLTNVLGTLNVLEAARKNKVAAVIHSSSMAVYGREIKYLPVNETHPCTPADLYGVSKFQAEELCGWYARTYGLNTVILRYSGIFGPGRRDGAVATFVDRALSNLPIEVESDITWDLLSVSDVIKANFLAFKKAARLRLATFNIGAGVGIHILKLASLVVQLAKSKSVVNLRAKGLSFCFFYDITKAKKLLGFVPSPLSVGIRQFMAKLK